MEKTMLAPGIFVYHNVIPGYENIINDIESVVALDSRVVQWSPATVRTGDSEGVYSDQRDTMSIGIPYLRNEVEDLSHPRKAFETALSSLFLKSFGPIEKDYQDMHGVVFSGHDSYGILKYGVGQKFTNHIDDHPSFPRRISMVYYLNEDYSGGEINFPRFGISYKPRANEALLFPSTFVYNHSVSEVTEGTRYAVVSWIL
jgi:hypothetical protein